MNIAIIHYSLPPVVGGVEAVIRAHTGLLVNEGYSVRLIAGVGELSALPAGTDLCLIPEMDSRNPAIVEVSQHLSEGTIPSDFDNLSARIENRLSQALERMDTVIVHNVFTKHFNLPLTTALFHLLQDRRINHCIAWCHDFSWTSSHSRSSVHQGYPWDLLRTYREDVLYVTISQYRQKELAGLFDCPIERIKVVYDGVDPAELNSLSEQGRLLVKRMDLLEADLILLMPVRITQAKNIEYAMQVLQALKTAGIHPRLVITGPPDPHDVADIEYYRSLLQLRKQLSVEDEARFVYESSPQLGPGYTIDLLLVRELYRVCDVLFMPSHREGFGMPILEAGLVGMPIFTTSTPAAQEIGGSEVFRFSPDEPPGKVAEMILHWSQASLTQRLRQRIRQNFTWQAIFRQDILPLLPGREVA
jgi:glycosyltransferase involved in cell wall biosynthesis